MLRAVVYLVIAAVSGVISGYSFSHLRDSDHDSARAVYAAYGSVAAALSLLTLSVGIVTLRRARSARR